MDDWTRVTILEELKTIIVETRGCREDEVVETATLFGDLGLESIDFLEISFRMEESFGFPYPTDELGWIFNATEENGTTEGAREALRHLREELYMDVPDNLLGVEPFDPNALDSAIRGLFTVGSLVTFVEHQLAEVKLHRT
ncbi:TPA: hypothetical protein DDZ10_03725 [Candidatus Uhrbacteria bacterium]|uniref:Putative acyl carrier protein n=1 Tax=Candidatus Uhrbacteria bacterium GW2011_GWC2_53_7 TaxID=1618986 RepID=A0A0G1XUE4_9BACT|nr:MAG: putative acyl carrier protein [Candidatus Uhrbacteria bacterium GW2011_GWC2_53_7]OGL72428.1 MAG: hypothetical protein A3D69_02460 [Candidatus Uhrbacteria bacterium RIFCSPHIGHO2_02_FULL_54_11]HBL39751.1 hypothetical protein [Candidatus Uhrbacteria bacterium]